MTKRLWLHVVPSQGSAFDHPWDGRPLVIGRASDADLALEDEYLSRHHSRLFRVDDEARIEDLGSRNGTLLNGKPVRGALPIRPGDEIRVCSTTLTLNSAPGESDGEEIQAQYRPASAMLAATSHLQIGDLTDAGALRRYAERLRLLNEVHQALAASMEVSGLLELILDRAFAHLQPEEGALFLVASDGTLEVAASRSREGSAPPFYSRSLVREVTEKKVAALVYDAQHDPRFSSAQSIRLSGVRSLAAAPLLDGDEALGMIVLGSRIAVRAFSEEDLELLVSLASVAALRLKNVRLAEEAAERRALQHELALARRIQEALLPDLLPEIPGWRLQGSTRPSQTVSGDYFQVIHRRAGDCVIMVSDVSGKGVAASLLTTSLEAMAAGPIEDGLPPAAVCDRLAARLFRRTPPEKFATAFVAAIDPTSGTVRYCSAGHNPALVLRCDRPHERLNATGPPLGLLPDASYAEEKVALGFGDTLLVYTDGVTEALSPEGREYGLQRLGEVAEEHRHAPLPRLLSALEADLEAFTGGAPCSDDVTLVAAQRHGDASSD